MPQYKPGIAANGLQRGPVRIGAEVFLRSLGKLDRRLCTLQQADFSLDNYDAIVIGAGHNGLVCAAYLAKGGQRVLVLEAADVPGGLAGTREFHPGFRVPVAHIVSHFPQKIADQLDLRSHGFDNESGRMTTTALAADRSHVHVVDGALRGASDDDADAFQKYLPKMRRFADALSPFWLKTMPRIGAGDIGSMLTFAHVGWNIRRLGRDDMQEFLRIVSLPARDMMDECFADDTVKALLAWDGLTGMKLAPRSPNGAMLALLYRLAGGSDGAHACTVPGLVGALEKSASAAGAEIRYGASVSRVLIDDETGGLATNGVELDSGETIGARRVISAADPQTTFLKLVGVRYLDIGFTNRIRRLRTDGYVAKLHVALNGEPVFDGLESASGRMLIAAGLDTIEFAFDHAKYGELPEEPVLELVIPSLHDSSLAPAGQHVLSAHVMYVPYRLAGGWSDAARERMRDIVIDKICRYAPTLREQILHAELLTPADLESAYRVSGGHWHHTEFSMDQMLMMRPTYEAAQYSTPIPGLYLCGAGSHPGGDLTGAPGHNAAREILRSPDRGARSA